MFPSERVFVIGFTFLPHTPSSSAIRCNERCGTVPESVYLLLLRLGIIGGGLRIPLGTVGLVSDLPILPDGLPILPERNGLPKLAGLPIVGLTTAIRPSQLSELLVLATE